MKKQNESHMIMNYLAISELNRSSIYYKLPLDGNIFLPNQDVIAKIFFGTKDEVLANLNTSNNETNIDYNL